MRKIKHSFSSSYRLSYFIYHITYLFIYPILYRLSKTRIPSLLRYEYFFKLHFTIFLLIVLFLPLQFIISFFTFHPLQIRDFFKLQFIMSFFTFYSLQVSDSFKLQFIISFLTLLFIHLSILYSVPRLLAGPSLGRKRTVYMG